MVEQACQALEAVLSPLMEGLLCEQATMSAAAGGRAEPPPPPPGPYPVQVCVQLLLDRQQLRDERFPVTIRRRLEGVAAVAAKLNEQPDCITADDVCTGETAMRGVVSDCIKAAGMPSLLASGSRQFVAFVAALRPALESHLELLDALLGDCKESAEREKTDKVDDC